MYNEEQRIKYQDISTNLKNINNKLNNLKSDVQKLNQNLQTNITINNKGLKEETLTDITTTINTIETIITNNILPSINNKLI